MSLLLDIILIVLAVIGGLLLATLIAAAVGWAVIRGIRAPSRTADGDEDDEIFWA